MKYTLHPERKKEAFTTYIHQILRNMFDLFYKGSQRDIYLGLMSNHGLFK